MFSVGVAAPWGCISGREAEYNGDVERSDGSACGSVTVTYQSSLDRTAGLQTSHVSRQGFSQSVTFRRGPPAAALTTTPSQRAAPLPSVNTSTEYSRRQGVGVVANLR